MKTAYVWMLQLRAGRELDALIHHHVLGRGVDELKGVGRIGRPEDDKWADLPAYSSSEDAAHDLLKLIPTPDAWGQSPSVAIVLEKDGKKYRGEGPTEALALCRAIIRLKAGMAEPTETAKGE